ncbi:MgtC/SapB family protein [Phyllobacterium brassicacearum]
MEREWRKQPAGLKTHKMVCMASATFAIVALRPLPSRCFSGKASGWIHCG